MHAIINEAKQNLAEKKKEVEKNQHEINSHVVFASGKVVENEMLKKQISAIETEIINYESSSIPSCNAGANHFSHAFSPKP